MKHEAAVTEIPPGRGELRRAGKGEAGDRADVRRIPGDGCRRKSGGVPVALYSPEKSALGEGEGAWGRGANCQTKVDTKNTPSSFIFSTVVL